MEEKRTGSFQNELAFQVFVRVRPMTRKETEIAGSKSTFRNVVKEKGIGEVF